ncbi:MAG: IS4/IS5 family transposase, partial [bacterium]
VSLWAISVREIQAPPLVKPIDWMLLTTIKIETFDQAWQCVQWYTMRWVIERYPSVLTRGCQVEELQLEEADRIKRALAVSWVGAWRLLFLTYTARMDSEQLCETMLEPYDETSR